MEACQKVNGFEEAVVPPPSVNLPD